MTKTMVMRVRMAIVAVTVVVACAWAMPKHNEAGIVSYDNGIMYITVADDRGMVSVTPAYGESDEDAIIRAKAQLGIK